VSELQAAPGYVARFVNVHIGSHLGAGIDAGTTRLAGGIARVMAEVEDSPVGARLVLENSAGSGFGLGTRVSELAGITRVRSHGVVVCTGPPA
jgi:deoxyribonuclease-4